MTLLCPLEHGDGRDRQAAQPSPLCAWHVTGIRLDLERIAAIWPDLTAALANGGSGGQRVTGTPEKRLPINETASDVRQQLAHDVHFLARVMIDESDFVPARDEGTVSGLARWLSRHHDWLSRHELAAEFAETVAEGARSARAAAYPMQRRRFEVHPCPEDACVGVLSAHLNPSDDLLPSTLRCSGDVNHVWTSDQWMTLARRLRKVDAQESA